MEGWFAVLFRIPFTIYFVCRDLRTDAKWKFLLARKMYSPEVGYYYEAI